MSARIIAVHRSPRHGFSKQSHGEVTLLEGLGVEGDAHAGATVRHRSRVARDPTQPNLRQVHLLHRELLDALASEGYPVTPGALGENLTTNGIALLELSTGTRLRVGGHAIVEVTGLRNPCTQLDKFAAGLMRRLTPREGDGTLRRLGGVMGVVMSSGVVRPGDSIAIELAPQPHRPLEVV